jgi:hypothetical protein
MTEGMKRKAGGKNFKPLHLARASNVPVLGRTRWMGHLQKAATNVTGANNFQKMADFLSTRTWTWACDYAKGMLAGKYKPYPTYALDGKAGVYQVRSNSGEPVRLSIVGDWGTGTEEAWKVAESIAQFHPDYTLHLGDVYFVGDEQDVKENFLGQEHGNYTPVAFPKGAVGTFALIGNHEMYVGGGTYFTHMLPYCETGEGGAQQAAFFCLESEHWRFIGIDTGYNSVGKPILGSIPHVDKIHWVGADCALQQELLDWLRVNVRPQERRKATVLLSHHQYFSSFKDETFRRPSEQLREFFAGQDLVWIWGHEHRVTVYERYSPDGNLTCWARCLGHGGMPVECGTPDLKRAPAAFYDARCDYPAGDGSCVGWNGYLNVTVQEQRLELEYRDLNGALMFRERFTTAEGAGIQQHTLDVGVMQRVSEEAE